MEEHANHVTLSPRHVVKTCISGKVGDATVVTQLPNRNQGARG